MLNTFRFLDVKYQNKLDLLIEDYLIKDVKYIILPFLGNKFFRAVLH